MSSKKPHAIMISLPYQGHLNPFVNLALKLASKGILVTFVHLEYIHHRLFKTQAGNEPDPFHHARQSGLDIRYTTISDGFPLDFDRLLNGAQHWASLCYDFPALADEFVGKLIGSSSSDQDLIHFLVTDTCYTWPASVAKKYNLVNVSFWTEPAMVFTLLYHWDALIEKGHVPCNDCDEEVDIDHIPGIPHISRRDLMSYLKEGDSLLAKTLALAFSEARKADFFIHNTVHELEHETLLALNSYKPNYAIGPINFSKVLHMSTINKSLWSESDCTEWLDSKPCNSVLYISFGSLVQIPKQVIEEIAYGLLSSEVNFLWVIREGIVGLGEDNIVPNGFRDEMKDRGMIVPWCNQINVLSSLAVGGFLTHNGWNSTIESMWCGVPMLCYPVLYDQPTNRKLVVEDWKIGMNLCDGSVVDRESVAETIKRFMSGNCANKLRHEASRVKETVQKALDIDGSSERNIDRFITELKEKLSNQS